MGGDAFVSVVIILHNSNVVVVEKNVVKLTWLLMTKKNIETSCLRLKVLSSCFERPKKIASFLACGGTW